MKLLVATAALLITAAPPAPAPDVAAQGQSDSPATAEKFSADPMNFHSDRPGCRSVLRQVQDARKLPSIRRGEVRTLDREPPAHLLLAVDRHVDGCREVTFVQRNIAPSATMPNVALPDDSGPR